MTLPPDHLPIPSPRIGVLLINLGTPDAPDTPSVKRYLAEFLSDRRVVELSPIVWQPLLRGVVLTTRPQRSAAAYREVWGPDGSPLAAITKAQSEALQGAFGADVMVDWAMRYGQPSIPDRLTAMKDAGCECILLASLYPQYCAATTATAHDKAFEVLAGMRWQPAIRTLPPYHDDPLYIAALETELKRGLAGLDFEPEVILTSFHGMPQRTLEMGDPYHCQCRKTARLLGEAMERPMTVAFQSRFGRAKWLEPATDATLKSLAEEGVKRIVVTAPGFSTDCLETLEEVAMQGRDIFLEAGGTHFAYLPCLNASAAGIAMLKGLVMRELAGWVSLP